METQLKSMIGGPEFRKLGASSAHKRALHVIQRGVPAFPASSACSVVDATRWHGDTAKWNLRSYLVRENDSGTRWLR